MLFLKIRHFLSYIPLKYPSDNSITLCKGWANSLQKSKIVRAINVSANEPKNAGIVFQNNIIGSFLIKAKKVLV